MAAPVPTAEVIRAVARSFAVTARLVATRRLAMPRTLVGARLPAGDGTSPVVFRETAVRGAVAAEPVVLVVWFRLRWIGRSRWAHAVFRRTCLVNTPLFAGFPGFVDKLWLADPDTTVYRGLYDWDGAAAAEDYAARLSTVLALVAVRGSIGHRALPGIDRSGYLSGARAIPTG